MALAQDHAVAAGPFRLLRPVAQHVVVEHAHDLDERHRRADMAALAAVERRARPAGADPSSARRAAASAVRRPRWPRPCIAIDHSFIVVRRPAPAWRAPCQVAGPWPRSSLPVAPASTRRCQRSGRNSLSRIEHPAQRRTAADRPPDAPRSVRRRRRAARRRRESAGVAPAASGMPGWSRMSAVSFTGSSQPKYSKSTKASDPSWRRRLLWKPKSEGTRLRPSCGSSAAKSRPAAVKLHARPARQALECRSEIPSSGKPGSSRSVPATRTARQARRDLALDLARRERQASAAEGWCSAPSALRRGHGSPEERARPHRCRGRPTSATAEPSIQLSRAKPCVAVDAR